MKGDAGREGWGDVNEIVIPRSMTGLSQAVRLSWVAHLLFYFFFYILSHPRYGE